MFSAPDNADTERQLSMLPPPAEDAILSAAANASKRRRLNTVTSEIDKALDYAVIGEKQFKNPKLFPPPSTKGLDQPRTISFGKMTPDDQVERSIKVLGNNVTGCYTSDTLAVIAVINDMWQEQGANPDGLVIGSYADVARRLGKNNDNPTRNRGFVKRELDRLRRCVLIFSQFHTSADIKNNHEITYFSEYFYHEDRKNPSNNFFQAELNHFVLVNLRTGYISSLPLAALLELKNDNSKPVLLRIDSVLASQEKIELASTSIYDLLSIDPDSDWFRKPSTRKKVLSSIKEDLNGKTLSSGWTVIITLEPSAAADYKLTFARGERRAQATTRATPRQIVNTDPMLIQQMVNNMVSTTGARENEKLFTLYARSYSEENIHRAIAEFKADKPNDLRNPGAYFSTILMRIIQEQGLAWIK